MDRQDIRSDPQMIGKTRQLKDVWIPRVSLVGAGGSRIPLQGTSGRSVLRRQPLAVDVGDKAVIVIHQQNQVGHRPDRSLVGKGERDPHESRGAPRIAGHLLADIDTDRLLVAVGVFIPGPAGAVAPALAMRSFHVLRQLPLVADVSIARHADAERRIMVDHRPVYKPLQPGNSHGQLSSGSDPSSRQDAAIYEEGRSWNIRIPAGVANLVDDDIRSAGDEVRSQPAALRFPLVVPRPDGSPPPPASRLRHEGCLDLFSPQVEELLDTLRGEHSPVEEVLVDPVGQEPAKRLVSHAVAKEVAGAGLVEVGVGGVAKGDVRIPIEEAIAAEPGRARSPSHPVVVPAPVPVIAGVEIQHHVVGQAGEVDPVTGGLVIIEEPGKPGPGRRGRSDGTP